MLILKVTTRPVPFLRVLLVVVLANYAAQVVYDLHLYASRGVAPAVSGSLLLGLSLVGFLVGFAGTLRGSLVGYLVLVAYLMTMVGFYALNQLNQLRHGMDIFSHLGTHDSVLWVVFAIGYLNMLVGAWALALLLIRRRKIVHEMIAP